jgi:predicted phage baseplate assembly protein
VARGNIALADHGRALIERYDIDPPLSGEATFRLRLREGPLTMQSQPDGEPTLFPPLLERPDLSRDVRQARPALALQASRSSVVKDNWWPVPDLLSSSEFQHHFVADVDNEGRAVLRFGDGEYGQLLTDVDRIDAWYRVGNGRSGNIGADSLSHIVVPFPVPAGWPTIEALRNPLPAQAGVDPELIEQVRQYAPAAFRAQQYRAVTEEDYKNAALTINGVAGAVASFRWTGSWYTVFVGIDPLMADNVLTDIRGVTRLEPAFKKFVQDSFTRYRLAGYDIEIRSARYVPLDIAVHICAKEGYFPADVAQAVAVALSSGVSPHGVPGFFNPANLTFGQTVYLSRIYAAIENVDGVESATVTAFHRHGREPVDELGNGKLPIGAWEIARLDNNPSNMENGTLTIIAGGGS